MEIFGLGAGEWLAVFILILVLFGPRDMEANARKLAQWARKITHSDLWNEMQATGREISQMPAQLAQEAGLKEWEETRRAMQGEIGSILPPGMTNLPGSPPSPAAADDPARALPHTQE